MLKLFFTACVVFCSAAASTQTLFTYANDTVTVPQFFAAYQKNNAGATGSEGLRTYLDLYIASRLKIKEALARHYDTLPQLTADLAALREQIMPAYLHDEAALQKLTDEARLRAQKDIHLQTIFIAFERGGIADTAAAAGRVQEALRKIKSGQSFEAVAREFSDDPSVRQNSGDAGFITVFSLPYEMENMVFNTPVGQLAPLYTSRNGYHIFKNAGERPALGTLHAAQILIAFPPGAGAAAKTHAAHLADSLYRQLQKGASFAKLAGQFSNDAVSSQAEGEMPPFGIGTFDPVFEKAAFELSHDGAITQPFETSHGWHIVKRLQLEPANGAAGDEKERARLREKVEASDRMATTDDALAQSVLAKAGFKKANVADAQLWAFTDSLLDAKGAGAPTHITTTTPLFTLGDSVLTAADWLLFAQTFRYKPDGSGLKPYGQVWDGFVQVTALAYYKDHLEVYNEAFRNQLQEFKDGNLFFEIMQREVWNKAQDDTTALQTFYNAHAGHYIWQQSADAVVFYTPDAATASKLRSHLLPHPEAWKEIAQNMGDSVAFDSARFELAQLPNEGHADLKKGLVTQAVQHGGDSTASFAYILQTYNTPVQRSFAEAKGAVVADYQAELEKKWTAALKKKYQVQVNEKALRALKSRQHFSKAQPAVLLLMNGRVFYPV